MADIKTALSEPGPLPSDYLQQIATTHSTTLQTVYNIKRRLDLGLAWLPLSGGPVPVLREEHEKAIKLVLDKRL
jgi:hypothetical protein